LSLIHLHFSHQPYWYTSKNISCAHYLLCNIKILWDTCRILHTTLLDIYPFLLIQRVQMLRAKYLWKKREKDVLQLKFGTLW
jgi:hypothetical protein